MNNTNQDNSTFFDQYSKKYDIRHINNYFSKNLMWFIKYLPPLKSGDVVADVGCGTGILCNYLATMYNNAQVHGIDISEKMIQKARKQCENCPNTLFCVDDVHSLNIEDNTYDFVFNTISFHHYPDPQKAIAEFYRILKPNGKLFLMDSITDPFFFSFMPHIWDITERKKCYTKHLSSKEFKTLFCNSQFRNLEYKYYSRFYPARHILCIAQK